MMGTGETIMTIEEMQDRTAQQEYEAQTAEAAERLKNQVTFAENIFRGLVLLNGGAMVALFTFIGTTAKNGGSIVPLRTETLWLGFAAFVAGLVLVMLSTLCAFFSQLHFYNQAQGIAWNAQSRLRREPEVEDFARENRIGNRWLNGGVVLAALSLAAFIFGCACALQGVLP